VALGLYLSTIIKLPVRPMN